MVVTEKRKNNCNIVARSFTGDLEQIKDSRSLVRRGISVTIRMKNSPKGHVMKTPKAREKKPYEYK